MLSKNTMVTLVAASLRETRGKSPSEQAEEVADVIYRYYARMEFELEQLQKDLEMEQEIKTELIDIS